MKQMGFIKKKIAYRQTTKKVKIKKIVKKKKVSAWTLNEKFPYIESLQSF